MAILRFYRFRKDTSEDVTWRVLKKNWVHQWGVCVCVKIIWGVYNEAKTNV